MTATNTRISIKNNRPLISQQTRQYEHLCRDDPIQQDNHIHLKCQYINYSPYIYIAPVKMEKIHTNPDIWAYHDVISNIQIETMKNKSLESLVKSRGFNKLGHFRVSKHTWLEDRGIPMFEHLSKLVEAITNLTLITAEPWQVI